MKMVGMGNTPPKKARKPFFLEKKNQKTFGPGLVPAGEAAAKMIKSFLLLFSKKKCFADPPSGCAGVGQAHTPIRFFPTTAPAVKHSHISVRQAGRMMGVGGSDSRCVA
jgi:hypothetical protein